MGKQSYLIIRLFIIPRVDRPRIPPYDQSVHHYIVSHLSSLRSIKPWTVVLVEFWRFMSGTLKRRSTKNKQKQSDRFSETWGTSTAWRSATPRQPRPGLAEEKAIFRPGLAQNAGDIGSNLPEALNKPLPALPPDEPLLARSNEPQISSQSRPSSLVPQCAQSSEQHVPTADSSLNKRISVMKKLGLFQRASRGPAPPPLSQQDVPHPLPLVPILAQPALDAPIQPVRSQHLSEGQSPPLRMPSKAARASTAVVLSQLLSGIEYVDASTQTSPRLLPNQALAYVVQSPIQASPKTSSTGQKGFWTKKIPNDYFSIPFRQEKTLSSTAEEGPFDDPESVLDSRLGKQAMKSSDGESSKSGDSIGTYESRYSESESDNEAHGTPKACRSAISESSLRSDMSSEAYRTHSAPSHMSRSLTAERINGRPKPIALARLSSFSANRGRRNISGRESQSRGSSVSPLRHSIQMPDTAAFSAPAPPTPEIYQQLVLEPEPQSEYDYFIPDHLKGSPLCPRSPKHASGGVGFCPMHGGSDSGSSASGTIVGDSRPKLSELKKNYTDGSVDDIPSKGKFRTLRHDAESRDCPANSGSTGLCVFHRRFRLRSKNFSEESVNRVRLRAY